MYARTNDRIVNERTAGKKQASLTLVAAELFPRITHYESKSHKYSSKLNCVNQKLNNGAICPEYLDGTSTVLVKAHKLRLAPSMFESI